MAVIMSSKYQTYRTTLNVLLITLARLMYLELTELAALSLEMLFAIITELKFITMYKLCVIG